MIDNATDSELVLHAFSLPSDAILIFRLIHRLKLLVVAELFTEEEVMSHLVAFVIDDLLNPLVLQLVRESLQLVSLQLLPFWSLEPHVDLYSLLNVDHRAWSVLVWILCLLFLVKLSERRVNHLDALPADVVEIEIEDVQHLYEKFLFPGNAQIIEVDGHE